MRTCIAARAAGPEQLCSRTRLIAIIGIGCRLPGGVDTAQIAWDLLHGGK